MQSRWIKLKPCRIEPCTDKAVYLVWDNGRGDGGGWNILVPKKAVKQKGEDVFAQYWLVAKRHLEDLAFEPMERIPDEIDRIMAEQRAAKERGDVPTDNHL